MALNPAAVLNANCNFVNKVLDFLNKRKYIIGVCPCTLYSYFIEYMQGTNLDASCLTYEQECSLNNNTYQDVTECEPTIMSCGNQLDINIVLTGATCTLESSIENSVNGSAYPVMSVSENSPLITGQVFIKVLQSGNCGSNTTFTELVSGTTSSGISADYESTVSRGIGTTASFTGSGQSYITTLRVYTTDVFGTLVNTPIDLDLDPNTSPYYSDNISCPGCTAILPGEVEIGAPGYEDSMTTLFSNISLALFNETPNHSLSATGSDSDVSVYCTAYNNPSSYYYGINFNDALLRVYDPVSGITFTRVGMNTFLVRPSRFYGSYSYSATDSDYACADLSPVTVGDQWTLPNIN